MSSCTGARKCEEDTIFITIKSTDGGDVLIEVRDRGVGCSDIPKAFEFCSSSSNKRWDRLDEQQSYAMVQSPLQSLGVGLPLSRHMMEYFGSELDLRNNDDDDGGCTASLLLKRDSNILEQLPIDTTTLVK
jgi:nitrogen fixation/metabolism regulation signal transduction histidine kinase